MNSVIDPSACLLCRSPVTGAFCGSCAAPGPEILVGWEATCLPLAEDGVLDEAERYQLEDQLQHQRYNKQADNHTKALLALLGELGLRLGKAPVQLNLDEEAVTELIVGKRAELEFQLSNPEATLKTALRLVWRTGLEKAVSEFNLKALGPKQLLRIPFPNTIVPDRPGRYMMSGMLEFDEQTPGGRTRRLRYSFEQPIKVGEVSTGGPQSVSVSIHADQARVMNTENLGIGVTPISRGGVATETRWHPLSLLPIGAGEAVRRKLAAGVQFVTAFGGSIPAPQSVEGLRTLRIRGPAGELELIVSPMPAVRMGRDLNRCDIRLAVEPFHPPERYQDNLARSFRVRLS